MAAQKTPYIFIDTCSLLETCWNTDRSSKTCTYSNTKEHVFWNSELPALETIGTIIIPTRVYEELQGFANGKKDAELANRSQHLLFLMEPLINEKRIQIVGDKNDPFADSILLSVALKFITKRNLLFITQDRALAKDLDSIGNFESIARTCHEIKVRRIGKSGKVKAHRGLKRKADTNSLAKKSSPTANPISKKSPEKASGHNNLGALQQTKSKATSAVRQWWEA